MARNALQIGDDGGNPLSLAPWQVGDPTDPMVVAGAQTGVVDPLSQWLASMRAKSDARATPFWNPNNPVGTETTRPQQSMSMPDPSFRPGVFAAGPIGQYIDPVTGRMTEQGQARMADNPMLGFDTGGLSTGGLLGMIKAYHGSPHQFDAFDMSKIGTGEGAQAYGHGMYLAENEGVAKAYKGIPPAGTPTAENIAQRLLGNSNADGKVMDEADVTRSIRRVLPQITDDELASALASAKTKPPGHMYEVKVNADPERFLHWDKPLSEQHPEVRDKLSEIISGQQVPRKNNVGAETTGGQLVQYLEDKYGDKKSVADDLAFVGIPGIKYLDQGSRSAGEGSHNYVVFDANTMNIIRRYGLAGLMAGGGAAAATQQQQPNALQAQ